MRLVHLKTEGRLPTSSYNLVAEGGDVIGFAQLRHRASQNQDLPPEAGNHVFYTIAEPRRGQGHGKTTEQAHGEEGADGNCGWPPL